MEFCFIMNIILNGQTELFSWLSIINQKVKYAHFFLYCLNNSVVVVATLMTDLDVALDAELFLYECSGRN